jgi:hypothetical protein
MKTRLASSCLLFVLSLSCAFSADSKPEQNIPAGLVNFSSTHAVQVLQYYADLGGKELVISSHVKALSVSVTLQPEVTLKVSELLKLIEKALLEQTGIVITTLNEKQSSVTYNDALPVKAVRGKPLPLAIGADGKPLQPRRAPLSPPPANAPQK